MQFYTLANATWKAEVLQLLLTSVSASCARFSALGYPQHVSCLTQALLVVEPPKKLSRAQS